MNPFHAEEERLKAAAFADKVLLAVCLVIGLWLLADWVAVDLHAWITGQPPVMVAR